tara:strand:+ start:5209 stop:6096 length:888 start_codon:yes stop_codon:yes gene_type:complete
LSSGSSGFKNKKLNLSSEFENFSSSRGNSKDHWENLWDNVDLKNEIKTNNYDDMQEVFSLYKKYLPKKNEGKILEAGCGLGAKLLYWHNLGYDIVGIDYVKQSLQKLCSHDSAVKVVAADIHCIPFPNDFFKVYLSYGVMEHIETGYLDALKEAYRVLDADGILVFMVPHDNWITNFNIDPNNFIRRLKTKNIIRKIFSKSPLTREQLQIYDNNNFFIRTLPVEEIKNNLIKVGFKVLSFHPIYHGDTLYELIEFFHENDCGKLTPFARKLAKFLKFCFPWFSASSSMTIAQAQK